MNNNELNSVINNICEKLGTTMDMLIPEMAGYSIARWSIGLVVGLLFIAAGIFFFVKISKMRKQEHKYYIDKEKLNKILKEKDSIKESELYWITNKVCYCEDDYGVFWLCAIACSLPPPPTIRIFIRQSQPFRP